MAMSDELPKGTSSYQALPTVHVKSADKEGMLVNVVDFDAAKHEIIGEPDHPDVVAKLNAYKASKKSDKDEGKKESK